MKAYIGPYVETHFRAYLLFNKYLSWKYNKPHYMVVEEDYTKTDMFLERVCDKLQDVLNFTINKITANRKRNIKIRIDPHDTWSMDHTLALIIHPMLVQLRDTNHGYFFSDPEDAPSVGKGDDTDHGLSDSKAQERYNWIMEELIWTFNAIKNDDDYEEFFCENNNVWDQEGLRKQEGRIKNGLRLFGKYYRSLWD